MVSQFCTHRARPENLDSASLHLGRGQTAYSLQDTLPGSCKASLHLGRGQTAYSLQDTLPGSCKHDRAR